MGENINDLIEKYKKENDKIRKDRPDLKWVNDYSPEAIKLFQNEMFIHELSKILKQQSLPDDNEVGNIVDKIAYKQYHEDQADDFLEKVWMLKRKIEKWFGKEYKI